MVRRILITGANKGIGLAVARRCLADHEDTHVILGCRSVTRAAAAVAELVAEDGSWRERTTVLEMDASSAESITAAAATLEAQLGKNGRLYGIVNNAGRGGGTLSEVLTLNVRGPQRVDKAFIPLLEKKKGRIVQMSSGAASGCVSRSSPEKVAFFCDPKITWAQIEGLMSEVESYPNGAKDFEANGLGVAFGGAYGLSKALLNSYTLCLAREQQQLRVNSCSPGMIATDFIGASMPWWVPLPNAFFRFLARKLINAKTPDEGAVSTLYLLFTDDKYVPGGYFGSDAKRSPLDKYRSPGSEPYDPAPGRV